MEQRDPEVNAEVRALIERGVKKSRVTDRVLGLVATFVIAGSIGGIGVAVSASASRDLAKAERALCQRVLDDRLDAIRLREVQVASAQSVVNDPAQSAKTRRARLAEARRLQASINDLRTRADPANGGQLVCSDEFPDPGLL